MKGAPLVQPSDPGDRYRHTRRQADQPTTRVKVGNVVFGGERLVVAAGPCSVEPDGSLLSIAQAVAESGASMLRGGAYKPRTSPYDFQGLGPEGLRLLSAARAATGLPVVTEVLDPRDVDLVARHADMFQIGSRSIQNYPLLHEVAAAGLPVLLKRGMMTTVDEWLSSAEYLLDAGAGGVVLCERGIRTFETSTRNTLDLNSVAYLRTRTHLPLAVDPSHAAGDASLVPALCRAAVAVGADGLLVEVHTDPAQAFSDGDQSLTPQDFRRTITACRAIARALNRDL